MNVLYISLSGNTKYFISRLTTYFEKERHVRVSSINVKEHPEFTTLDQPFVTFLPAFLKGGNGVNNGYTEILTTILGDYLAYEGNYQHCYGIIGSGNRNFNKQFALTAKQYAKRFDFPYITDFELRGTAHDIPRIADAILTYRNQFCFQTTKE
ncbi:MULTISPECIES: class Ib ribonucleoside-diphosphate reductase assembly flavoprotein NrdI [Lactiplantibacillus]|uniref:class Ib ribonucleoside-diphosphate reductase assembly flavoprotein NrdI n=1 Tax=Lactiplantibacillus TaxID=2767842 RepID=UPI000E091B52|nr:MULTISPECIES: class Ib ribonucleoside-diphosphate reductase assembly flavoprotein NrdI [Lactiplantibacillus]MBU7446260.1 class Ib ribonucleoside-diphosphate reductase assembly flavoprotein NrdI [Lactiplantibacillus plantarum]MBU7459351.1 class Ib ribonucleoside-diphosphate reductase assembly flavoprotein NrdI [Lactiplantibacillus plantarum]MBU7468956.1 class Ib ribonucleoside-diphosphate reductase assembly flavoprotein NrdI [Lactiplantibacillus plantarum]MDT7023238.1 class Ib ribonucleoside-